MSTSVTRDDEIRLSRAIDAGRVAEAAAAGDPVAAHLLGDATETERRRLVDDGVRARAALIMSVRGLGASIARERALHLGLPVDDMVQEALVALIDAVDCYDHHDGPLVPYVAAVVRRAAATSSLTDCGRRHATAGQLRHLVRSGRQLPPAAARPVSLDGAEAGRGWDWPDDTVGQVFDAVVDPPAWLVRRRLSVLLPLERAVVERHYGFRGNPQPCAAAARAMGISPGRARRLLATALERLRNTVRTLDVA